MIPERFALILAIQSLLIAAIGGGVLGAAVSLMLRLRWSWGRLLGDMLAGVVATASLVLVVVLYDARHHTNHGQGWIFVFVGAAIPALGHLLIYLIRRAG